MATNLPSKLARIELKPTREKSALLTRLIFQSSASRPETIEFELCEADAMQFLSALQLVQRRNGWKIPPPTRGKPNLRIVRDD